MSLPNPADASFVEDFAMGADSDASSSFSDTSMYFYADTWGLSSLWTESIGESQPNWDAAHDAVQNALTTLTGRVVEECPGVDWKAGRSNARAFRLFSYRVFYHLDGDDYDPIVVGVTFAERGGGVRITGDISGDESGHIYFDEHCEEIVAATTSSVVEGGGRIAGFLASQHRIVIQAIRDRHPRAIPP